MYQRKNVLRRDEFVRIGEFILKNCLNDLYIENKRKHFFSKNILQNCLEVLNSLDSNASTNNIYCI